MSLLVTIVYRRFISGYNKPALYALSVDSLFSCWPIVKLISLASFTDVTRLLSSEHHWHFIALSTIIWPAHPLTYLLLWLNFWTTTRVSVTVYLEFLQVSVDCATTLVPNNWSVQVITPLRVMHFSAVYRYPSFASDAFLSLDRILSFSFLDLLNRCSLYVAALVCSIENTVL